MCAAEEHGRVVGRWICATEEHEGIEVGDKASKTNCDRVVCVRRVAEYGKIGIFGGVVGRWMCAAEEHRQIGVVNKASIPKC